MCISRALRKAVVVTLWIPAVALAVLKRVLPGLLRPWRPIGLDWRAGPHSESLAYRGMSGRFSGTVVTLFVNRADVQSSLPPELTISDDDQLPDWLRGRDEHPVILLFGEQTDLGTRRHILGLYQTIPLFRPYLETFVAVPFLKPTASGEPCPCLHFVRVACSAFWPTELGILRMGWPKIHCPMQIRKEGQTVHYSIAEPGTGRLLLAAETDTTDPPELDAGDDRLARVVSMLAQPSVLIIGGRIDSYRFDLRLEAARLKAVRARGTVHPGLLPALSEPIDFTAAGIADPHADVGAFFLETTFMSRLLDKSTRTVFSTVFVYLRARRGHGGEGVTR
jgi:hypothetical protein